MSLTETQTLINRVRSQPFIKLFSRQLEDEDVEYLTREPTDHVIELVMYGNNIKREGIRHLTRNSWVSLRVLSLSSGFWGGNQVGNCGCKIMTRLELPEIKEINLGHNEISSVGMKHLSKSNWPTLKIIWIGTNKVMKEGVQHIIKSFWSNMYTIGLSKTELNLDAVKPLLVTDWPKIAKIILWENHVSIYDARQLQALFARKKRKLGIEL